MEVPLNVFDHDNGIVYHKPRSQRDPEQSQCIDRKSQQFDEGKRADERNRNSHGGNDCAAPVFEKNKNDEDDQDDRLEQRAQNVIDGFAHRIRSIECQLIFHSWREAFGKPVQLRDGFAVHFQCIRIGQLRKPDAHAVTSVKLQFRTVIFGAEFSAAHILQAYQRTIGVGLENDVFKLRGLAEPPNGTHADLKLLSGLDRRLPDLPGSHLDVLLLKRAYNVRRRQTAAGHSHRIQPQTHRVLALSKNKNVRHSRHAFQCVLHVHVEVIAHEQRIVSPVFRKYGRAKHEVAGSLGNRNSSRLHGIG